MSDHELRQQLTSLAAAAIPEAGAPPKDVLKRARRGQRRTVMVGTIAFCMIMLVGNYAVGATRNIVGPAPIAGDGSQGVYDPPDQAGSAGFSLGVEIVDGRICAQFDLLYFDGEESTASEQMCDPDPTVVLSAETRFVDIDRDMEPGGLVLVVAGLGPEVAMVEIDLPHKKKVPVQHAPIMDLPGHPRRITGYSIGREYFLDKQGDFQGVIRAFDAAGNLLAEQDLCDPITAC